MMRLEIKPLSVNQAWQGKRFKTRNYINYIDSVLMLLKPLKVPDTKLRIDLEFGLSSKNADIDNPVKCFIDCLQKKYNFNDRMIYEMNVKKIDVKKGQEFIDFQIKALS